MSASATHAGPSGRNVVGAQAANRAGQVVAMAATEHH